MKTFRKAWLVLSILTLTATSMAQGTRYLWSIPEEEIKHYNDSTAASVQGKLMNAFAVKADKSELATYMPIAVANIEIAKMQAKIKEDSVADSYHLDLSGQVLRLINGQGQIASQYTLPTNTGPQGPAGQNAQSPVFSVVTGNPGSAASVSGTYPNLTLSIPRGNTGSSGSNGNSGSNGSDGQAATISIGTVSQGTMPSVTNSGTSTNAVLNFTLVKGDKGADGVAMQGLQGLPGNAATVSVGTVTTGAAGSSASVTNSGTSNAAVLNFVIPAGNTGTAGNTGPAGSNANVTNASVIAALGFSPYNGNTNPNGFISAEVDGSTTNEIQTLSGSGNTLTLSSGGSYTIPAQTYSSLTGKPALSTVSVSGDYSDLINKPTIIQKVLIGNLTVSQTAAIAIVAGVRIVTITGTSAQVGDLFSWEPGSNMPDAYGIGGIRCESAGTIKVSVYGPALAVGASYSFSLRVYAIR